MIKLLQKAITFISSVLVKSTKVKNKIQPKKNSVLAEIVTDKKWYHLSFFYRGSDFQPPYFYIFVLFWIVVLFCILKAMFYFKFMIEADVSETFIISILGTFVGTFALFNVFNPKD